MRLQLGLWVATLLWLAPAAEGQELPTRVIQVVQDQDSTFYDEFMDGWLEELEKLAEGQYRVEVREGMNARGDLAKVRPLLQRALADPETDLVFAAGLAATSIAAGMSPAERSRPVVGGAIEYANVDESLWQVDGASSLENFTFVRSPRRVAADLERIAQLAGTRTVHAVVDRGALAFFGEALNVRVEGLERRLDIDLVLVPGEKTAAETLAAIPSEARAVYVAVLISMSEEERALLFDGLADRRILSLSMAGRTDVERGALAGLSPDLRPAIRRRMALNIHQVFNGIPTELLPVNLRTQDRLFVNMRTAARIGWSPDYDTVLAAEWVGGDPANDGAPQLTLEQAMAQASGRNPDVLAEEARRRRLAREVETLRTSYRPSLSLVGNGAYQGASDRINRLQTPRHFEQLSLGAELTQLLFSDRISSLIDARRENALAGEQDLESLRLDVTEAAGQAFLQVLLAEALHRIERENLQLIENNLQLAKLRREIGVAESSEVFRWQSNRARARAQLIQRDADRRSARVQLNVVQGVPRTTRFDLVDIELAADEFYFLDGQFGEVITNSKQFEDFLEFVKIAAVNRAPEIRSLERVLAGQGILLKERRRRNFVPEVSLQASYDHVWQDSSAMATDDENRWAVGIGFVIPLFEGGRRRTESGEIRDTIDELSHQRDSALYLIEQRALAAGYGIMASHPAMRLGQTGREAAERTYAAVEAKYSRGAATIVDLLDAQRELLSRKQEEAAAGYGYLQDLIAIQRSAAWFEYDKSAEEREAWRKSIVDFLEQRSGASR